MDETTTEVDVTIVGTASQAQPEKWEWKLNGGQKTKTNGNPSSVDYTLTIDPAQESVLYTITGKVKYKGPGIGSIDILLVRSST